MRLSGTIFGSFLVFLLTFLSAMTVVMADTLTMNDGSVLIGKVISQEKNTLKFKTSYAGTINIKWDQVKQFETDEPVTVMLVTDELISTKSVNNIANGTSQIRKEGSSWKNSFKTDSVAFINPDPWRLNQGYKISARANFALKSQHGNTTKDEIDMDGRLEFRSLQDRYIVSGKLENDTNKGKTTEDNWLITGKYDYFYTKKRYFGGKLSFERDRFTDLDLRTTLGLYAGHQFYESKALNLKAELGLSEVHENNIDADNYDYPAMDWGIDYDQYFFDDFAQFYHNHTGIWNLDDTDRMTLKSWTGFRFPLRFGVIASTEMELEYDSQPNESIDKTDITYRVKIGYEW